MRVTFQKRPKNKSNSKGYYMFDINIYVELYEYEQNILQCIYVVCMYASNAM